MSAQYEKAVGRLGKQCYQGYARGLIKDKIALGMCQEISETFKEAKALRAELEEEIERDALDGLSREEIQKADEHRTVTNVARAKREIKLRLNKFAGRQTVNWHLQNHRDKVRKLSHDLGLRALLLHESEPLLEVKGHQTLCELAVRLEEDASKKWDEIVSGGDVKGAKGISALSFHTILVQFIASFANFSKGTQLGDLLLKVFKYDSAEEEAKLADHYAGTEAAKALEKQLQEVDEPDLDIGREMQTMEEEYTATPEEWGMAPIEEEWVPDTESWGSSTEAAVEEETGWGDPDAAADSAGWGSTTTEDTAWSTGSEEESWGAAAAASSIEPEPEPPTPSQPVQSWVDEGSEPGPPPPPSSFAPRVGQAPQIHKATDDADPDAGWGTTTDEPDWPAASEPPAPPPPPEPPAPPAAPAAGRASQPTLALDLGDKLKDLGPEPGDELLPPHLRNREEKNEENKPFIPQLPDEDEGGLSLKPFGEDET